MAGFWIPWEVGLAKKREVLMIAKTLGISRREAAAGCMEVWEWANEQSIDGIVFGVTVEDISDAVGIPGLGEAMQSAGWIFSGERSVQFPNWDRYNAKSARSRFLNASRVRKHRANNAVTRALQ